MKRELLISFAGHLGIIITVALISSLRHHPRETQRPSAITVQILTSSAPEPATTEPATQLLQPPPKPAPPPKTPPKPRNPAPKKDAVIRGAGLGARIEGASALGYNFYLQQMLERIAGNWRDPYMGNPRNLRTVVMFVIERSGMLTEIKIEKSSGDPLFDESCLRAVIVTRQLPPLPAEFTAPRLKIHLEFER